MLTLARIHAEPPPSLPAGCRQRQRGRTSDVWPSAAPSRHRWGWAAPDQRRQRMTREAGFKRRVRARMASTGEAYSAARAHLDRGGAAPAVLHVTNGDSVSGTLRAAGLGGRVLTWADVLHDGPVPGGAPAGLRRARAAHLAARGWGDAAAIERRFAARDRLLERCA